MPGVVSLLIALNGAVRAAIRPRCELVLENLALRQQLALLHRKTGPRRCGRIDRLFWMWLSSTWSAWTRALGTVRPLCAGTAKDFVGSGTWRSRALGLRRTSFSIERNPSARMPHGEPQSVMGVRRASTASSPSSGARSRSARSAGFCRAAGVRGRSGSAGSWRTKLVFWPRWILRRTDRDIPRALRLLILAHEPRRIVHFAVTRRRLRGQRSKLPRRSHGKRLRGVSSEIATRPTAWSSASGSNELASPN